MRLAFFLLMIFSTTLWGQEPVVNVNLPDGDNGGTFIGDLLYADGKIFAYSPDGISVYNESDNNAFVTKIGFKLKEENGNETPFEMGKFNPVYSNPRLAVPDQCAMANNESGSNHFVFAITPKQQLLIINSESPQYNWTVRLEAENDGTTVKYIDEHLKSQSGRLIVKFDSYNNRLYVLTAGKDTDVASLGCFHEHRSIFAIFDVAFGQSSSSCPTIQRHYSEINYSNPQQYPYQINNYVINENTNYYYLIRLGYSDQTSPNNVSFSIFETWEITNNGSTKLNEKNLENTSVTSYYKMGKILYIQDFETNLDKIMIFPYKYFEGYNTDPKCHVIDITNNITCSFSDFALPSKWIQDAVYLENGTNKDIAICYSPEIGSSPVTTNTTIYRFNSLNDTFQEFQSFTTDNSILTSSLDINSPICFTKTNNSNVLISKKDGVAKLAYNTSNNNYDYTSILNAESNFFYKGISNGTNTYILNLTANGISKYNGISFSSILTGYPVYHIVANADGTNQIYFNKLEAFNNGFYYKKYLTASGTEVIKNNNSDEISNNDITTSIGDIVYNPHQNHFLVSQYNLGNSIIKALNAETFKFSTSINLNNNSTGTQFVTKMFVSPNGYLYVWANMVSDENRNPTIFIYNADDYSFVNKTTVSNFDYNKDFTNYTANFCYNYSNNKVYSVIAVQDYKLTPYNKERSSIYNSDYDPETPKGKLIAMDTNFDTPMNLNYNPGKIIFPGNEVNFHESQYYGKMYITGDKLYQYDYIEDNLSYLDNYFFTDISYNEMNDKIFATREISTAEHRQVEIWTIYFKNGEKIVESCFSDHLTLIDGQTAGMFSNKYNGRTYIYNKIDSQKLGDNNSKLYSFDPSDADPEWAKTDLGIASYFPDYDHTRDLSKFYFNNAITPYINPYTNTMYIPNGGHSCISKVEFEPVDMLTLTDGINWISIPRHDGNTGLYKGSPQSGELYDYDYYPTENVLHKDNFNDTYTKLELNYYNVYGSSPGIVSADYNISAYEDWSYGLDMANTYSYKGYKLDLTPSSSNTLTLSGKIENPNATIKLVGGLENWVGYFILEEQDIFDAIADFEEDLYAIKSRNYYCYKSICHENTGTGTIAPSWICDQETHNIKYGDMVILKSYDDIEEFRWNYTGNPPLPSIYDEAEYYSYTEKSDYSPLIIELDSTENPIELGAFINDSCIGACTVSSDDTLAIIKGYLDGQSGDSVVFEEYFGTKSSQNNQISDYFVLNEDFNIKEKRTIKTREQKDRYFISFKNNDVSESTITKPELNIYPNPTTNSVNMIYSVNNDSFVTIRIMDNFGRLVNTICNNQQNKGHHIQTWDLSVNSKKLSKGLYIIKLTANGETVNKKLIVQ